MKDIKASEKVLGIVIKALKSHSINSGQQPLSEIDIKAPFSTYSFNKAKFLQDIGQQFDLVLALQSLWEYPHIEEFAQHIAEEAGLVSVNDVAFIHHDHLKKQEAIAIVGLACRFPGGVNNVDDFWNLMLSGKDPITEIPLSRWDINDFYDEDYRAVGKMNTRFGGFLDNVDLFDAPFFNISPKEAVQMDPQQRIFLEVAWQAIEQAAINPEKLAHTSTGVFVGVSMHDYERLAMRAGGYEQVDAYSNLGAASSSVGSRLSYFLGLNGPSFAIDTACSSSMSALYNACLSLRSGDCDLAISGGVNLVLDPEPTVSYSQARMMAPDGRCKTFDVDADGYVRSEGCGVVILKRLDKAIADGDQIFAVIRSTVVNQDGASNGFTAPNMLAQKQMLRDALYCADLQPDEIDFLETHGTGTFIGDPIEVDAINQVYHSSTRKNPLYLGAIKSQIGHCEAASGIAGILKTVLALHHQQLPGNLHFNTLNPAINLNAVPCAIPTTVLDLSGEGIKRAGVSSYGFTGTNTHAILEQAPALKPRNAHIELPHDHLFILSAKTKQSLLALIQSYREFLVDAEVNLADMCYTLAVSRSHFSWRFALSVTSLADLKEQLNHPELLVQKVTISNEPEKSLKANALIKAYLAGTSIDWLAYYSPYKDALARIKLPTYCFDRQRYWIDVKDAKKQSVFYHIKWVEQPVELNQSPPKEGLVLVGDESRALIEAKFAGKGWLIHSAAQSNKDKVQEWLANHPNRSVLWVVDWVDLNATDMKAYYAHCFELAKLLVDYAGSVNVLTCCAEAVVAGDDVDAYASSIRGFLRSLALEQLGEENHFCLIDVDELDANWLGLLDTRQWDECALRQGRVYERTMQQAEIEALADIRSLKQSGYFLITGGLGALGLLVAEHLISEGARYLCLVGRRAPSGEAQEKIDAFRAQGVEVVIESIDVSDSNAVSTLVSKLNGSQVALSGVIHAAGVFPGGCLFTHYDWFTFYEALPSKILGAIHLHNATKSLNLSYFIMFSSIVSSMGAPGLTNYALANSFLDGLIHHRKHLGLPGMSINWGPWQTGMGTGDSVKSYSEQTGIKGLSEVQALHALSQIMFGSDAQLTVAEIDWAKVAEQAVFKRLSLIQGLLPVSEKNIRYPRLLLLQGQSPALRRTAILNVLREQVAGILGAKAEDLPVDVGFFVLGMDSLMAVDLRDRLQTEIGDLSQLSASFALDYPTINHMLAYFEDLLSHQNKTSEIITLGDYQLEPIAVIGMAGVFPGGCNNPEQLWQLLIENRSAIGDIPASRWDAAAYYDADKDKEGKMYVLKGGFVEGIEYFDPDFFNISPREALLIDPLQRLLLETGWHALEDSGISPDSLRGSLTGIVVGSSQAEYGGYVLNAGIPEYLTSYTATGAVTSAISGRFAYALDLQGPCMTLDTACSSSLVAIHTACEALRSGNADLMLAGGVNLNLSPEFNISLCKAHMLAEDGLCKTFDEKANGYVRSEGCAVVVLKRLTDAVADGDAIYGVILASTVNQDGASGGLTVPNRLAQEQLMRRTLAKAKLSPDDVGFIEAHGTGTELGDPIEISAITAVYGESRSEHNPLVVSALKSHIGHLEAASGVAGLIKILLSFNHKRIPGVCHFNKLNPKITLNAKELIISGDSQPWQEGHVLRAGLSAFGFTGTNAHVILEEAPVVEARDEAIGCPDRWVFVLSAKSESSLIGLIADYIDYLSETDAWIGDICYTAATGRSHFNYRLALNVQDVADLLNQLQALTLAFEAVTKIDEEVAKSRDASLLIDAYRLGKTVNWQTYFNPYKPAVRKVRLPGYCFDKKRYWIDRQSPESRDKVISRHVLLQHDSQNFKEESYVFTSEIGKQYPDFLQDHKIYGEVVVAGATYISTMMSFAFQVLKVDAATLHSIEFIQPLVIADENKRILQIIVNKIPDGYGFEIYSLSPQNQQELVLHATGQLEIDANPNADVEYVDLEALRARCTDYYSGLIHQEHAAEFGLQLGSHFHWLNEVYHNDNELLAALRAPVEGEIAGYDFYPGLVDSTFQLCLVWLKKDDLLEIPLAVERFSFKKQLPQWIHITKDEQGRQQIEYLDSNGLKIAQVDKFVARPISDVMLKKIMKQQVQTVNYYYLDTYEPYAMPDVSLATKPEILLYASSQSYANWSKHNDKLMITQAVLDDVMDLSNQHVVFVYEEVLQDLVRMMRAVMSTPPLSFTLITQCAYRCVDTDVINPWQKSALGLWKTFRLEDSAIASFVIDVTRYENIEGVMALIVQGTLTEPQLIIRDGLWVPRLVTLDYFKKEHKQLDAPLSNQYLVNEAGIDSLHWADRTPEALGENQVHIKIKAISLNFRDVLKAMGLYPGDAGEFGYECAGEILHVGSQVSAFAPGDKVIAFSIDKGLFGDEVFLNSNQVLHLPKNLDFAQGASVPIVYSTAFYGLMTLAKLKTNQNVLIHAATGGVGMAAIALAHLAGAQVYATTSASKQAYVRNTLNIKHVYDSRSNDFGAAILADTDGQGVDVVLNSLTSEGFIESSLACLKQGGVFLEIGKLNIYTPNKMNEVRPDVIYHIIETDTRMKQEPDVVQDELTSILQLFAQDQLQPFPITPFKISDSIAAFHYLQQAKHMGKVVVINPEPFHYKADATYLITGGTGGLGLELAKHLIEQGVTHLALTSRSAVSDFVQTWIHSQHEVGIEIAHYQTDVTDEQALAQVFDVIAHSGYPLKGIFHTAGVVHDGMLMNLTDADFNKVLAPKIEGSQHLDALSRNESLDCFVLFSSIASLLGNPGQANYSAANAYMDGLAAVRQQQGLPALSIHWGPFASVGMAAHLTSQHKAQGMLPLEVKSAFQQMDALLTQAPADIGIMQIDWQKIADQTNPYLSHLVTAHAIQDGEWISLLEATPAEKRESVLISKLKQLVAQVLTIQDATQIDSNKGFFEMGLDSLMAVDLKNKLQLQLADAVHLTNTIAFDYANVKAMSAYLLEQLHFKEKVVAAVAQVASDEAIAIVGLSGEFPGAQTLAEFWQLLIEGREGISEIPATRWDVDAYYDADPKMPGKMNTRRGGFIRDIEQFDSAFFGISPKEATYLDPQQRLLLRHTWQALEHAGIAPESLLGSDTGVFIGIATHDYSDLINRHSSAESINAYIGTGNAMSTASGRISYTLGLEGPNLAIDTACSSSLVALNEACERLSRGECRLAIVGGVNALLTPEMFINFSKAGMLSPDGKCKTFDEKADGYVRGEGCGILIIKRLSDALANNDHILAVVKASGINQDGASSGLTVPNGPAQERLLSQVLAKAGLVANDVDYVECHGTGTSLGDPIEMHALGQVYGVNRTTPLYLGSAKTNIGHLEAAAGVAGLIKVILALNNEQLPAHLNFHHLNPHIDMDFPGEIVTQVHSWASSDKPRRSGVSSFGFSGTNAHVILEEAPGLKPRDGLISLPKEYVFVLSAKSRHSLEQLVVTYCDYLKTTSDELGDICYTAAVGRSHFNHRLALVVHSRDDLLAQLASSKLSLSEAMISEELVVSQEVDVLKRAYLDGSRVNWIDYYRPYGGGLRKVILPTYRFESQRYWIEGSRKKTLAHGAAAHDLLGARLVGYGDEIRFLNELQVKDPEYLASHVVFGEVIVPGAAFIESILAAGQVLNGTMPMTVSELSLLRPLRLTKGVPCDYQVSVMPSTKGYDGRIDAHYHDDLSWNQYVSFQLVLGDKTALRVVDIESLKQDKKAQSIEHLYAQFTDLGLNYGPEFQVIREAYVHERQALVLIEVSSEVNTLGYCIHPTLLDGAFQTVALLLNQSGTYIPSLVESLNYYQPAGHRIWVELQLVEEDAHALKADLTLYDEQGFVLCEIQGFRARATDARHLHQSLSQNKTAEVYIESVDEYELPPVIAGEEAIMLYVSGEADAALGAPLSWARGVDLVADWSSHHVVVVYDNDLLGLVALAQRALKEPPLSLSIVVQNAFDVADAWLVNPSHREIVGFWRTLTLEAGGLRCFLIDANPLSKALDALPLIAQDALPEPQLILRSESVHVPRLYREEEALSRAHKLKPPVATDYLESGLGIDTLYWAQRDVRVLDDYQLRVRIEATALNFRDVLKAMDLYPGDAGDFGYECAGVVVATGRLATAFAVGERVLVIGQGLLTGEAVVDEVQVCHLPKCLGMAQGAAIPLVFLTANYGLNRLAKIAQGQKVLIHAAAGGVGLAAIELARLVGAEIYATASALKQDYVRHTLGIEHVYDSRSTDFGALILADTNGEGVDVVLNSLTGAGFIESSLSCLKQGGVFLEIGKLNIYTTEQMDKERPDVTYHVIELDTRLNEEPEIVQQELRGLLTLFDEEKLHPLPVTEYAVGDSIAAFHYLQQAKHVGKVVLINPEAFHYKSQATYLITGGTGGLGLELAKHLIEQGVKHLALTSRSAVSDTLQTWLAKQAEAGVKVRHYQADVADEQALSKVFEAIAHSGHPLKGIFHTAGVVHDGMLMNLTAADFNEVLAPKVEGSRHLDALSRNGSLDCFVLFSSIASVLGNPGQANYSAANAYMDGLAKARRHQGLPALSINWGPFASVGMAAHLTSQHKAQGLLPLEVKSAFQQMDVLLTQAPADVAIMQVDWQKIADKSNPYLSHLVSDLSTEEGEWMRLLEATPEQLREVVLINRLKQLLAEVLTIQDATQVDSNKGFFEMGLDSLMAVDLKNKLEKKLGHGGLVRNTLFFDYPTVSQLVLYLKGGILEKYFKIEMDFDDDFLDSFAEELKNLKR